jgi:hypothetical protein
MSLLRRLSRVFLSAAAESWPLGRDEVFHCPGPMWGSAWLGWAHPWTLTRRCGSFVLTGRTPVLGLLCPFLFSRLGSMGGTSVYDPLYYVCLVHEKMFHL